MKLKVLEATPDSFGKFGSVFKVPRSKPLAETDQFRYWSDIAEYKINGATEIGWCTVFRHTEPVVTGVERHLSTPEILIPVDAPFILPVMKEGEGVDTLEAFRVNVGEAVIIGDGIWHAPCIPVGKRESSYFVIFRKGTPQEDVIKKEIPRVVVEE
ncbi:MAG: ureidoglycolate lyase [Ignavibacteriales bacterium]|nr:ureidoglycolate lyase [Ignavibacteriales bacterium]